ncbi:MAG: hypothetical protein R6V62_08815 [Candidatus Fermentibacteraceae bacterium]
MIPMLCAALLLQFPAWSLNGEVARWLGSLANRGYTVFQYHGMFLDLNETATVPMTLQAEGECIFGAMGGATALVVQLELLSGDEILYRCGTDDLPMIHLPADSARMVSHMRLEVTDMTHGATAESVFVYAVVRPVDPGEM